LFLGRRRWARGGDKPASSGKQTRAFQRSGRPVGGAGSRTRRGEDAPSSSKTFRPTGPRSTGLDLPRIRRPGEPWVAGKEAASGGSWKISRPGSRGRRDCSWQVGPRDEGGHVRARTSRMAVPVLFHDDVHGPDANRGLVSCGKRAEEQAIDGLPFVEQGRAHGKTGGHGRAQARPLKRPAARWTGSKARTPAGRSPCRPRARAVSARGRIGFVDGGPGGSAIGAAHPLRPARRGPPGPHGQRYRARFHWCRKQLHALGYVPDRARRGPGPGC